MYSSQEVVELSESAICLHHLSLVMASQSAARKYCIENLLHPSDYVKLRDDPLSYSLYARDSSPDRRDMFRLYVSRPLDQGNYSRISRGVSIFVSFYHSLNEVELSTIHHAKELLEEELTHMTNGLVDTSAIIELNKAKLRRPNLDESARQQLQATVLAAQATLENDLKLFGRLLEDIGVLAGIDDEET